MSGAPSTDPYAQAYPIKSLERLLTRAHANLDAQGVPRPEPVDTEAAWQAFRAQTRRTA